MTLDSAQAKAMAAQPRLNPLERDELINLLAEGKSNTELAVRFGKAPGTIANFKSRNKDEIAEVQRRLINRAIGSLRSVFTSPDEDQPP